MDKDNPNTRRLRVGLFDLDNTLYPPDSGVWDAIGERMNRYMVERLAMDREQVAGLRQHFLDAFGTTLNGLKREYRIDAVEFLDYVHDLPLGEYLKYDRDLDGMLERLPLRKFVFTNADAAHARRVLRVLGIERHFEGIIDIHLLEMVNKPDPRAYTRALEIAGAQPEECVLVEDSAANVMPALRLGMLAVLVGNAAQGATEVPLHIPKITHLEALLESVGRP